MVMRRRMEAGRWQGAAALVCSKCVAHMATAAAAAAAAARTADPPWLCTTSTPPRTTASCSTSSRGEGGAAGGGVGLNGLMGRRSAAGSCIAGSALWSTRQRPPRVPPTMKRVLCRAHCALRRYGYVEQVIKSPSAQHVRLSPACRLAGAAASKQALLVWAPQAWVVHCAQAAWSLPAPPLRDVPCDSACSVLKVLTLMGRRGLPCRRLCASSTPARRRRLCAH